MKSFVFFKEFQERYTLLVSGCGSVIHGANGSIVGYALTYFATCAEFFKRKRYSDTMVSPTL